MRNLEINKSTLFVCNYKGEEDYVDEDGFKTGEKVVSYSKPIQFKAHLSGARGSSQAEMFGTEINYDKTFVLSKLVYGRLRITENSVFFVGEKPSFDENGLPKYNYNVSKIAETVNEVAIAISKVRAN